MLLYGNEIAINAKVSDILARFEKDTRVIRDYRSKGIRVTYSKLSKDNTISIYSKVFLDGKIWKYCPSGNEVIRFEISRETDSRSSIKFMYDENDHHEFLCYFLLTRLGNAMGAEWAGEMYAIFNEIECEFKKGAQWGWANPNKNKGLGVTIRKYALIPKTSINKNTGNAGDEAVIVKEMTKQRGRYRLTNDEIKRRKTIVRRAKRMFHKSHPPKNWKIIALELGIPERTLRDWRHNPIYS